MELDEVSGWVRAFAFTQAVEVPLYVLAFSAVRLIAQPAGGGRGLLPMWRRVAVAFLCSLLSHPVVWFGFPRLIDPSTHYLEMVVAAETFAVTSEAAVLWAARLRFGLPVALVVNMTSMSLGFLVRYLFGWF